MNQKTRKIGIIPAGGIASRLSPIPCSKEILPVSFGDNTVKVSGDYLVDYFTKGGADLIYFSIKPGKWDIPGYFKSGKSKGSSIAYFVADEPYGVPFTVNKAFNFVKDDIVMFGFPDILIKPENAFSTLIQQLNENRFDVVLGLFPVADCQKWDMVEFDKNNNVTKILIKPASTDLKYTWTIAVWNQSFTAVLNRYCEESLSNKQLNDNSNYQFGESLLFALANNINIGVHVFADGKCVDIGTPDDFKKVVTNGF